MTTKRLEDRWAPAEAVKIRRVVCPVDFSDISRRALDYAIAVSRWYRSSLLVLHVHHVPVLPVGVLGGPAAESAQGSALSAADRLQLQLQLQGLARTEDIKDIPVEFAVAEGDVATEILAEASSADIIVMGAHGRTGFDRLVLGSVAEKVLRKTTRSVLAVPVGSPDGKRAVPSLFHHILAAIDFSEVSLHALGYAVSLAEEADAHLTMLYVAESRTDVARSLPTDRRDTESRERRAALARNHLRELVPETARVYCHIDERVETGEPCRAILRVAAERDSTLIVMGAHGAGIVDRLLAGSTTEDVVRQARCPVLAVRNAERIA